MVIVQVIGGTASQMSALARGYLVAERLNKELVLDVADYDNGYKFPYALDYFQDINYRKLTYAHVGWQRISEGVVPEEFIKAYQPH